MKDFDIRDLLFNADETFKKEGPEQRDIASAVRRKFYRGRMMRAVSFMLMAFLAISFVGVWQYITVRQKMLQGRGKIALLESRLTKLETKTESKLEEVDKSLNRLSRLNNYLQAKNRVENMESPVELVQHELDNTGSIIVNYGDRLYRDYNLTRPAIDEYNRVIKLIPKSKWAEVAKQRINNIKSTKDTKRGAI
jgi:hypothetical protein